MSRTETLAIEVQDVAVVDYQTPSAGMKKMVLVTWKNVGTLPIYSVKADIQALGADGKDVDYFAEDYYIFVGSQGLIAPGETYCKPQGEGHVLLPILGVAEGVRVSLTEVRSTPRHDAWKPDTTPID